MEELHKSSYQTRCPVVSITASYLLLEHPLLLVNDITIV